MQSGDSSGRFRPLSSISSIATAQVYSGERTSPRINEGRHTPFGAEPFPSCSRSLCARRAHLKTGCGEQRATKPMVRGVRYRDHAITAKTHHASAFACLTTRCGCQVRLLDRTTRSGHGKTTAVAMRFAGLKRGEGGQARRARPTRRTGICSLTCRRLPSSDRSRRKAGSAWPIEGSSISDRAVYRRARMCI